MRQQGFSLIELMIATTIGLVITLAVSMAYLGGIGTQRSDIDATRLNEASRFAFDLLKRELRKAGFRTTWLLIGADNFCATSVLGSAIDGRNDPTQINPTAANFTGTAFNISNRSDVLRVRFYGEGAGSGDGSVVDCQGYSVGQSQLVEDTLFVAVDTATGEPSLFCNSANLSGPGGTATNRQAASALVTGVESLQLLYGEDTDQDGVVNRYVPRSLVGSMDNVLAVKVSMVARGPDDVNFGATAAPTFNHFSTRASASTPFTYNAAANGDAGAVFSGAGQPLRRRLMLSTEIALRNFRFCD